MAGIINNTSKLQIARDATFDEIIFDEDYTNRASRTFLADELPYSTNLYARVRHTSDVGTSDWSSTSRFKIKVPASVIGVCLDLKASEKGRFFWIDNEGRKVENYDYTKHPVFRNITMVTEDSGRTPVTMTKIPLFYIKTATMGPPSTFSNGKKCWWISDVPLPGFRPHLAFKRSTAKEDGKFAISPYVTIGTYMANSETVGGKSCLGSGQNRTVLHSQPYANYKKFCANRNNETIGQVGWRLYDVYDEALIRLLTIIMRCDADATKISSMGSMTTTGGSTNRLVFVGTQNRPDIWIDDLWRFYYQYLDNITLENYEIQLTSPMDNTTALELGDVHKVAMNSGWIRDFAHSPMVVGDHTHNVQELFLPSIVTSAEAQSPIGDTLQAGKHPYMLVHGSYNRGSNELGLLHTAIVPDNGDISYVSPRTTGCRICKN